MVLEQRDDTPAHVPARVPSLGLWLPLGRAGFQIVIEQFWLLRNYAI
jgi:hypothetical protein